MKANKNRFILFLMCMLFFCAALPMQASAGSRSGTCGENVRWVYNDSTCELSVDGTGAMADYQSRHASIDQAPWSSFSFEIETVTIGRGVTRIGNYAFEHCGNMTGVIFYDQQGNKAVLSGGRYDRLMSRMGKKGGALGFAVYLDDLDRMEGSDREYDVDIVFLYTLEDDLGAMYKAVRQMIQEGSTVLVEKEIPEKLRYRKLIRLDGSEVVTVEEND